MVLTMYYATKNNGGSGPTPPGPDQLPKNVIELYQKWKPALHPPKLNDEIVVYVSAPLFNMAENLYGLGINGINSTNVESLIETICGLQTEQMDALETMSKNLGVDPFGMAGMIAKKGWRAYIPARDGFVLAKFVNAVTSSTLTQDEKAGLTTALTKAIYGNDVYALGAVCNVCLFNGNGLQIDDGSATEVGLIGARGLPMTIYRSQVTDQFGPGASNPMPLGCASSMITARYYRPQTALDNLAEKIGKVQAGACYWWSGADYSATVPPPPLFQYWLEVGEAVYLYKYKSKRIQVDENGLLDVEASVNQEFYDLYYAPNAGTADQLIKLTQNIKKRLDAVDVKWKGLIKMYQ